jgi:hypothetical protein
MLAPKCVIPTEASRRDVERRNLAPGDPGRAFADRLAFEARFLDFARREAGSARNDPFLAKVALSPCGLPGRLGRKGHGRQRAR